MVIGPLILAALGGGIDPPDGSIGEKVTFMNDLHL